MIPVPLPKGLRRAALDEASGAAGWPVCLLLRETGAAPPELILLHNVPDARAYLGALCDGDGCVREWLEIWVQNTEDGSPEDVSSWEELSNARQDEQWRRRWQAERAGCPGSVVSEIPIESARPLWLDPRRGRLVQPSRPGGGVWRLCRSDQVLGASKLPTYSLSARRFLVAEGEAGQPPAFVSVARDKVEGVAVPGVSPELGFDPVNVPFNPQGGGLVARVHPLLDLGDYADLLGGATFSEIGLRKPDWEATALQSVCNPHGRDGRRHGFLLSGNNAAEVFYLKLRLVGQAAGSVLRFHREQQAPLLNLDPSSFGVSVNAPGELPWPWTTHCHLARPGRARQLLVPGTDRGVFVALGSAGSASYCPAGLGRRSELSVVIRPLRVSVDDRRRVSVEGGIYASSPLALGASDVVRFRLSEPGVGGDFYGTVLAEAPGLRRDFRFRTWPRELEAPAVERVRRCEGGKFENCWMELIPALSAPYDLYSLAVLGVRALVSHERNPLPEAVDALERLGREVGKGLPAGAGFAQLSAAVAKALEPGPAYPALRAQHVWGSLAGPGEGAVGLPPALWAEVLAMLIRWMPGLGAASQCADYGAVPAGGLHLPLQETLPQLEALTARARSLVFSDWEANREIREVLAALRGAMR